MKRFKSFGEYELWMKTEYKETPVLIDDGWLMSMDMMVECDDALSAVRAFEREFLTPETRMLIDCMKAGCEDGTLTDCTDYGSDEDNREAWKKYGGFKWAVENVYDGLWYVYLNATGNFLGRKRVA